MVDKEAIQYLKERRKKAMEIKKSLKDFSLSQNDIKVIVKIFNEFNWNNTENVRVLKGFDGFRNNCYIADKLNLKTGSREYYNGFYYNEDSKLIYTYAEGDIYLSIFKDKEEFENRLAEVTLFYENN